MDAIKSILAGVLIGGVCFAIGTEWRLDGGDNVGRAAAVGGRPLANKWIDWEGMRKR